MICEKLKDLSFVVQVVGLVLPGMAILVVLEALERRQKSEENET